LGPAGEGSTLAACSPASSPDPRPRPPPHPQEDAYTATPAAYSETPASYYSEGPAEPQCFTECACQEEYSYKATPAPMKKAADAYKADAATAVDSYYHDVADKYAEEEYAKKESKGLKKWVEDAKAKVRGRGGCWEQLWGAFSHPHCVQRSVVLCD